ncbi:hypothetical protein SDC9_102642 [bioreactor metagenome]|uniref:Uncharacterized protein n=1 Tax=bioreactor metagenome TaxID=1076179 RepID=A0A645ARE6_9ZZZZ
MADYFSNNAFRVCFTLRTLSDFCNNFMTVNSAFGFACWNKNILPDFFIIGNYKAKVFDSIKCTYNFSNTFFNNFYYFSFTTEVIM